jgi:hypothetical protein
MTVSDFTISILVDVYGSEVKRILMIPVLKVKTSVIMP